jgi:hypothetical protein
MFRAWHFWPVPAIDANKRIPSTGKSLSRHDALPITTPNVAPNVKKDRH